MKNLKRLSVLLKKQQKTNNKLNQQLINANNASHENLKTNEAISNKTAIEFQEISSQTLDDLDSLNLATNS